MKFLIGVLLIFGTLVSLMGFWFGTDYPELFARGSIAQGFTFIFGSMYICFTSAATAIFLGKRQ